MRIIDADAMCKWLSDWQLSCAGNDRCKVNEYDLLEDVYNAVNNFPTVGWIDVHNKMPKQGETVIGLYAMGEVAVFTMESSETFKKLCSAEYCTVSHWMPMPELPEECR